MRYILLSALLLSCSDKETEEKVQRCDELVENIAYRFCGAGLFLTKEEALNDPECQHAFGQLIENCYDDV